MCLVLKLPLDAFSKKKKKIKNKEYVRQEFKCHSCQNTQSNTIKAHNYLTTLKHYSNNIESEREGLSFNYILTWKNIS